MWDRQPQTNMDPLPLLLTYDSKHWTDIIASCMILSQTKSKEVWHWHLFMNSSDPTIYCLEAERLIEHWNELKTQPRFGC